MKNKQREWIVNYLRNEKKEEYLSDLQWEKVKISNLNPRDIKKLIVNILNLDISDDFFLSFESLSKIGEKAVPLIDEILNNRIENNFRTNLLSYISKYNQHKTDNNLIIQLYHPDFITRARTIMFLEENQYDKYLSYLLPLLEDPDDSVRWALVKLLDNQKVYEFKNLKNKLKDAFAQEINPIIKKGIEELLKKISK